MKITNQIAFGLLLVFSISNPVLSQDNTQFNSDVETKLKPWTNLDFYNDPSNFQFAIVSDNTGGSRNGIFEIGVEKLNLMMPEFVLSVGDLIQGYTQDTTRIREEWNEFNRKIEDLQMPFFYLPGNHDIQFIAGFAFPENKFSVGKILLFKQTRQQSYLSLSQGMKNRKTV